MVKNYFFTFLGAVVWILVENLVTCSHNHAPPKTIPHPLWMELGKIYQLFIIVQNAVDDRK